ncbi:MAG: amidohydrolase family protein [Hyphomicrobiaceae bacterium]
MARVIITNIGELFTGDIGQPISGAREIRIEDGRIAALGAASPKPEADIVIDAAGGAVLPGLVDGHVHPVFGEWTPAQDAIGWIGNYLHGGTTSMVSAGELHVPGIDYNNLTPEFVTSLAVVMAQTTGRVRWSGVKVQAGTALLVPGMTEAHFDRLAAVGTKLVKFLLYPFGGDTAEARRYVALARARGMRVKVHTGGVSRSGASAVCGYEILSWLQPDIAAHVSGGPIPMSDADLDLLIDNSTFWLEICSSGNYRSTDRAVRRMKDRGQLGRLTLGTDTPGGTGVIPRGMLRNVLYMASMCGLTPGEAVSVATGNTAKAHGLDVGLIEVGRPADVVACGPVKGSAGTSLSDAIAHGDLPGISHVLVDGQPLIAGRSEQTPPPETPAFICCCTVGGFVGRSGG